MREYRPVLYRAADAIDPAGRAREVADAMYAELFGIEERDGKRRSLFRYFHGISSLATWLRAVLSQRWVDEVRRHRRLESLPDDDPGAADGRPAAPAPPPDPDRRRFADAMQQALAAAVAALDARDRLRLGCYYAQDMTLAEIGRVTREHEATVSRHLARTRRAIREGVERRLRESHGFSQAEIDECFAGAAEDPGNLDVAGLGLHRKIPPPERSLGEEQS
jgi:RNA polymerase sigma factor (sigma-70 family)